MMSANQKACYTKETLSAFFSTKTFKCDLKNYYVPIEANNKHNVLF